MEEEVLGVVFLQGEGRNFSEEKLPSPPRAPPLLPKTFICLKRRFL
jgi:hypothetical protein